MKRVLSIVIVTIVAWMSMTAVAQEVADTALVVAEQVEAVEGMSESEAYKVHMEELALERLKVSRSTIDMQDDIIPLVAIISSMGFPVLIVFLFAFYKNKKEQARYWVMEKAIESGRELPEGFFDEPQKKETISSNTKMLHQGTIFTAIGAGLIIWGFTSSMVDSMTDIMKGIGVIFSLVGWGKLLVYSIKTRKENPADRNEELPQ